MSFVDGIDCPALGRYVQQVYSHLVPMANLTLALTLYLTLNRNPIFTLILAAILTPILPLALT